MIRNLHITNTEPLTYQQLLQVVSLCEGISEEMASIAMTEEDYYYSINDNPGLYDVYDNLDDRGFMYVWSDNDPSPALTQLTYRQFLAKYGNQKPATRRTCK